LTREDAIYEAGSCKVHVYSQYGPADGDFNSNNWHEDIWMGEDKNTKNWIILVSLNPADPCVGVVTNLYNMNQGNSNNSWLP